MAFFQKHKIRKCSVVLGRIEINKPKPKAFLSLVKKNSVRNHVAWLPTISATVVNSAAAISGLSEYQKAFTKGL